MFFTFPGISPALPLFVAPQQQQQQVQGAGTGSYGAAAGPPHVQHDPDGMLSPATGLGSSSSGQLHAALGAPAATTAAEQQQQQHNHAINSAFGFMPGRQLSYPSPLPEYSLLDDQPLQLQGLGDPAGAAAGAVGGGSSAALLGSGPNLAAAGLGLGGGGNSIDSLLLGGLPGEQGLQDSRLAGMHGLPFMCMTAADRTLGGCRTGGVGWTCVWCDRLPWTGPWYGKACNGGLLFVMQQHASRSDDRTKNSTATCSAASATAQPQPDLPNPCLVLHSTYML
jgi:hypothetical protein